MYIFRDQVLHWVPHCQMIWGQYLILDSAFLATLIVPNGSFDFLSTISCNKSSRKITHLGIGCMTVSRPLLSHQACMHASSLSDCSTCSRLHSFVWVPAISTKQCRMNFKCCLQASPTVHDAFVAMSWALILKHAISESYLVKTLFGIQSWHKQYHITFQCLVAKQERLVRCRLHASWFRSAALHFCWLERYSSSANKHNRDGNVKIVTARSKVRLTLSSNSILQHSGAWSSAA